jgi:hypothetical protein
LTGVLCNTVTLSPACSSPVARPQLLLLPPILLPATLLPQNLPLPSSDGCCWCGSQGPLLLLLLQQQLVPLQFFPCS